MTDGDYEFFASSGRLMLLARASNRPDATALARDMRGVAAEFLS